MQRTPIAPHLMTCSSNPTIRLSICALMKSLLDKISPTTLAICVPPATLRTALQKNIQAPVPWLAELTMALLVASHKGVYREGTLWLIYHGWRRTTRTRVFPSPSKAGLGQKMTGCPLDRRRLITGWRRELAIPAACRTALAG